MICEAKLSGTASCPQSTYHADRHCYYHAKMADGLISLAAQTLGAIKRNTEGDLARSGPYQVALKIAREGSAKPVGAQDVEARRLADARDGRRDVEALLHLLAAGDPEGWIPEACNTEKSTHDQGERPRRRQVRVWRQA